MAIDPQSLLASLHKVKPAGKNRWRACCPAHEDRTPSFKLEVASDGRILMHCFSEQCSIEDICASLGVEVKDLFPDEGHYKPVRIPANVPTLDTYFIEVIKAQIRRGETITEAERGRYLNAIKKEATR
jgi:hypothetical protein